MLEAGRKYARIERERRFLLDRMPDFVDEDDYVAIDDLFVAGTFVRVRTMRRPDGSFVVTKLGQKIVDPDAPDDPRRRWMTTIYLSEPEGRAFATLAGTRATKRRHRVTVGGLRWAIDVWQSPERAAGTVLAEIELPTDEALAALPIPSWAAREVTDDARYRSFALATR